MIRMNEWYWKNIVEEFKPPGCDKTPFGPGPWQNEPDKRQWIDAATGYACLIVRCPELGHWCGYVSIPNTHPLFDKFDDHGSLEVHGSVTHCGFDGASYRVECGRFLYDDEDILGTADHYFVGFDCAHMGDLIPYWANVEGRVYHSANSTYKDIDFVMHECTSLAAQLKALEPKMCPLRIKKKTTTKKIPRNAERVIM